MAPSGPGHPAPMAMTVAELEAAVAALPGKRDALREAFGRLAACSPSPLPFAWEDLDGHISSLQSSIALRFRQLRVLEAAGAAPAAQAALGGTRGDGKGGNQEEELEEEVVEVEVEEEEDDDDDEEEEEVIEVEVEEEMKKADEEIQEADSDKICNDEKDGKEAREVEVEEEEEVAEPEKADEDMQEPDSNKICDDEKDGKDAREVEVEEVAGVVEEMAELEKKADEEMQEANFDKICNDEKDRKEAREAEVEEVAVLEKKADEEMQEANSDKICNDEEDGKESREVEVEKVAGVLEELAELEKKADNEMQEANCDKICSDEKDGKEARETVVEEEEVEEAQAANIIICNKMNDEKETREEEQDPVKAMQMVDNKELNAKYAFKASQDKEDEDQGTNMDETAAKMASSVQACGKEQKQEHEAQEHVHDKVEGAKNATDQEAVVANEVEVASDRGYQALPCTSDDCTAASADMDAQRLVKLICTNTEFNSEFYAAARRAPDAAALALQVVELFLHNKIFVKTSKVWASCVELVQMVPLVVTKPSSADMIEQAKRVAKDWKEMIDNPESCIVLGSLASWGLLYFLITYNIVTEFDEKEIFCLFGSIPFKQKKKYAVLLKGLGLVNRIPELMDCLIGNGQHLDVLCLARIFNMVDKYPPLSLLKRYIEKAKQTAMEIPQKNMTHKFQMAVIIKELDNLRRAHDLAQKEITNSNFCSSIRKEINILIDELHKKKRSLANPLTFSISNSQQQQTKSKKKRKIGQKQEHHKGQENQMRGQLNELAEKLEKKQRKPQQEQQQKQKDKLEEKQQKQEDEQANKKQKQEDKPEEKKRKQEDKPEEKQQQNKQKHQKRLRQRTHQLPPQGYPAMWNAALRGDFEHPPYATIHGVHHGYPAQPSWPGVHCASPFIPQLGAPGYMGPFTPLYPRPQFYPW